MDLINLLIELIARRLQIEPGSIDPREALVNYGLDSHEAAAFAVELSDRLSRPLSPTLVWQFPTIELLAWYLSAPRYEPRSDGLGSIPAQMEPVAVVGMACRFPGAANVDEYWKLLSSGSTAISDVPPGRWDADGLFDPDVTVPGKMTTRRGGFLRSVDRFDAAFFGISAREARQMDPQQRLMLELTWEALEAAGMNADLLRGRHVGVFVGAMWNDYATLHRDSRDYITQHTATGEDLGIIANRISYSFGFLGPSMTIDTASSSSLVAVHVAASSLLSGESSVALAGGVNLMLAPQSTIAMSKFGGLSPDGQINAFDARASGYVRGEGGGLVILKTLRRALVDGDSIQALILGSAVNSDGFSNGLTAPNPHAQVEVLRAACSRAAIRPRDVHYVETHGTGTQVGDPIEAGALGAVHGAERADAEPLLIGSVKPNIGHLEAAAGIAGLIKTVLAIHHRTIPPSLHFNEPNPYIAFDKWRLAVPTSLQSWPSRESAAAGVSSFGFGGTNCHVVAREPQSCSWSVAPLAADTPDALADLGQSWVRWLDAREATTTGESPAGAHDAARQIRLSGACAAMQHHVRTGACRTAVVAESTTELRSQLQRIAGRPSTQLVESGPTPRVAFVFSGNGAQWVGMGRDLMQQPAFRAAIDECDGVFSKIAGWSLIDELANSPRSSRLDLVDIQQPVILAIQIALARLLGDWGLLPDAVVGHSMGEVGAAHVAGILSLEDAFHVILHRSVLQQRLAGQGGMVAIARSPAEVEVLLTESRAHLCIAAFNSPHATIVSGPNTALRRLLARLDGLRVPYRRVAVDVAYHGPAMDGLLAELRDALRDIECATPHTQMISSVTGEEIAGRGCGPEYWAQNMRDPVQFVAAIGHLVESGISAFVELSPHRILLRHVQEIAAAKHKQVQAFESLRRETPGQQSLLPTVARLYELGYDVNWRAVAGKAVRAPVPQQLMREVQNASQQKDLCVLPLSARTPQALDESAQSMRETMQDAPPTAWQDICYTAGVRRAQHAHRLAIVAASLHDAGEKLQQHLRGDPCPDVFRYPTKRRQRPRIAAVLIDELEGEPAAFCRQLMQHDTARHSLGVWDAHIRKQLGLSLLDRVQREQKGEATHDERQQLERSLLSAASQVALLQLLRAWGIEFAAAVGGGSGLLPAACVAGALTTAVAVDCLAKSTGNLAEDLPRVQWEAPRLALFSVRGRKITSLDDLLVELSPRDLDTRQAEELHEALKEIRIENLIAAGPIAVPSAWAGAFKSDASAVRWEGPADSDFSAEKMVPQSLARLYALGCDIDWSRVYARGGTPFPLPPYPWQRERYWMPPAAAHAAVPSDRSPGRLLPLHIRLATAPFAHVLSGELTIGRCPWLAETRLHGQVVMPPSAWLTMLIEAATSTVAGGGTEYLRCALKGIDLPAPLPVDDSTVLRLQAHRTNRPDGERRECFAEIRVYCEAGANDANCPAEARLLAAASHTSISAGDASPPENHRATGDVGGALERDAFYDRLRKRHGLEVGAPFRGVQFFEFDEGGAFARVRASASQRAAESHARPEVALLDTAFQVALATLDDPTAQDEFWRADSIEVVRLHCNLAESQTIRVDNLARDAEHADRGLRRQNVFLYSGEGTLLCELQGLRWIQNRFSEASRGSPPAADGQPIETPENSGTEQVSSGARQRES